MLSKEDAKSSLQDLSCLLPGTVASVQSQPYPSVLGESTAWTTLLVRFVFCLFLKWVSEDSAAWEVACCARKSARPGAKGLWASFQLQLRHCLVCRQMTYFPWALVVLIVKKGLLKMSSNSEALCRYVLYVRTILRWNPMDRKAFFLFLLFSLPSVMRVGVEKKMCCEKVHSAFS